MNQEFSKCIENIYESYQVRKRYTTDVYQEVLYECLFSIEKTCEMSIEQDYCYHKIPLILPGNSLYNAWECTQYVVSKLRKRSFIARAYSKKDDYYVYVSWNKEEVLATKKKEKSPTPLKPPKLKKKDPRMIRNVNKKVLNTLMNEKYGRV